MPACIPQSLSAALPFPGYAPLDIAHDMPQNDMYQDSPFPAGLSWSADDLVEAVRMPLSRVALAPSANDARLHRPRRMRRFLATPPLASRFRIGG